jgi:hypothetical protein
LLPRSLKNKIAGVIQNTFSSVQLGRMVGLIFVALIGMLQSGCMTPGEQLDRSAIALLQTGQTQAEVRKVFGTPKRTELGPNGKRLDVFQVEFARRLPTPQRALVFRTLSVLYSNAGLIENHVYHVGELLVRETRMGWEGGEELNEAQVRGIERERHSRNDLVFTFGAPTIETMDQNGDPLSVWLFVRGRGGFVVGGHELLVIFDPENRVKDYRLRELQR